MSYLIALIVIVALLYILPLLFKAAVVLLVVGIGYVIWSGHGEVILTYLKSLFK